MKDTKEIVMFFENGKTFDVLDVAKEFIKRFKVIGNPLILPDSNNNKVPLIVFNGSNELQVQVSKSAVTLLVSDKYLKKVNELVFDTVDIFEDAKIKIIRIGCISSIFLSPSLIDVAQEKFFNKEAFDEDMEGFNLSWYHKIDFKYGTMNMWERIIKDNHEFKELLMQYDFNTNIDDKCNIDMKFIKEFFLEAEEYIDSRIDL